MSITIASVPALTAACARAHSIDFAAYTLGRGPVRSALLAAVEHGSAVRVRLEGSPLGSAGIGLANASTVAALRAAGADAATTAPGEPVLHMKAAVVDGVAWLDDRNWAAGGAETVIRDSNPKDVAALRAALSAGADRGRALRFTKGSSQSLEADTIASAGAGSVAATPRVSSPRFAMSPCICSTTANTRTSPPPPKPSPTTPNSHSNCSGHKKRSLSSPDGCCRH